MLTRLTASQPAALKIIEERADGSGIVEIPILSLGMLRIPDVGALDVTEKLLDELIANFSMYPGPVPSGFSPHVEFEERGGEQSSFVEKLYREGVHLWARIALDLPEAFQSVVKKRGWRGYSVEMIRNFVHPSREFKGWVLVGGVFTNRPASDVVFKVAAEADEAVGVYLRLQADASAPEGTMSEEVKTVSLATHETKLAEVRAEANGHRDKAVAWESQVTVLKEDLGRASAKLTTLQAEHDSAVSEKIVAVSKATTLEAQVRQLQTEKSSLSTRLTETEVRLKDQANKETAAEVKRVVLEAIDAGVPGAVFDGYAADPAEWLSANYANLEAFKTTVDRLRTVGPRVNLTAKPEKSGAAEARKAVDRTESTPEVTKDEAAAMKKAGVNLDVNYVGVTNAEEAKARLDAWNAAKAASK